MRILAEYQELGSAMFVRSVIPKQHYNRTPAEIEENVLHLRPNYHLAPIHIVWYLKRYYDININSATVSRILNRNGMNRLPRGTRPRKVHKKRYNKQIPIARQAIAQQMLRENIIYKWTLSS